MTAQMHVAAGGGFAAYRVEPPQTPAPALVLVQEIFGVNRNMRMLAEAYAAEGWLVACPDLYWRQARAVDLDEGCEADRAKAMALLSGFDNTLGVADIAATVKALRADPACDGRVVVIGFCLGGRVAALATESGCDAAVAYYPVGLTPHLLSLSHGSTPLLVHLGVDDPLNPPPVQAAIAAALETRLNAELACYPQAGHAFARPGSPAFDETVAAAAKARTDLFIAAALAR